MEIEFFPTRCAICDTEGNASEMFPARLNLEAFNPAVFSARRLPDRIHYRIVRCNTCGLVRSDPVADPNILTQLYQQSSFDYAGEILSLKSTYRRYLEKLAKYGIQKGNFLEIGCGNGFFLEEALEQGFINVQGVEPSIAAVESANPKARLNITCDIMRPGLFDQEQFDVICMFQVLDHISNPGELLEECFKVLKPAGLVLCINHNIEAVSARLLKDRSPIVDIEHTFLYSPGTMAGIFVAHGFQVKHIGTVWNKYTLTYLTRLVPLPSGLKRFLLASLERIRIGRFRLSVPLGNLYLIAQKPNVKMKYGPRGNKNERKS